MRRKTIIVLAITFMVTVMVTAFSYLYISQILRQRINNDYESASRLTQQLAYFAENDLPDLSSTRVDTNDPAAVRRALTEYLPMDTNILNNLESDVALWPFIYDASVVDANGKVLLHTNPELVGKRAAERPDFHALTAAGFREQFRLVYRPATVYDVSFPLQLNDAPFGSIHIGVSTVFLQSEITPRLLHAIYFSIASIFISLLLAAGLSNLALGPLREISRNLDSVSLGGTEPLSGNESEHDEFGLVTLKIANLGRQMRDSREIFSALKDNVDQLMSKLQDGLMLFTRDSRVVLVSAPVERFLGRPRAELLGRTAQEIFSGDSALGTLVLDAFERKRPLLQREFAVAAGKRIQVSLDFVQEKSTQIGALLVMRDAESARRLEDEIEMSRRLSASGRVTGGVAHEVKNPINAIVLHLQLLQNKLVQLDPDTRRHMDIIGNEIHRLDRVVQTLVDFMRARELHMTDVDLRRVLDDVALLAAPDAEQHGVTIARDLSAEPLPIKADLDFMKQALLNVVLNGIQAMPQGGRLTISARRDDNAAVAEICDRGMGIAQDVQHKIFELYFTTKKDGNGIGLAQTYQILQWHYGSVEFESTEGEGTTFRFRLPLSTSSLDSEQESHLETLMSKPGT
ncbi:MAG: ATP-binding protein [Candidatus Sulfotelmatobacter sp.]